MLTNAGKPKLSESQRRKVEQVNEVAAEIDAAMKSPDAERTNFQLIEGEGQTLNVTRADLDPNALKADEETTLRPLGMKPDGTWVLRDDDANAVRLGYYCGYCLEKQVSIPTPSCCPIHNPTTGRPVESCGAPRGGFLRIKEGVFCAS